MNYNEKTIEQMKTMLDNLHHQMSMNLQTLVGSAMVLNKNEDYDWWELDIMLGKALTIAGTITLMKDIRMVWRAKIREEGEKDEVQRVSEDSESA